MMAKYHEKCCCRMGDNTKGRAKVVPNVFACVRTRRTNECIRCPAPGKMSHCHQDNPEGICS
eukprot:14238362-Ditylum_brightwellii.AAC.1